MTTSKTKMSEDRRFELVSPYKPTGDQPEAIRKILDGVKEGKQVQVILGATGTGKTFTDANIIAALNRPTLVMVHNKTLAAQLFGEFRELFPKNRVEYFVSNFDFYQPEAYVPATDTYIDKTAVINEEIDMMRSAAMNSILRRRDTIVVASVAAIYALSDPAEYEGLVFSIRKGDTLDRNELYNHLLEAQYSRNNFDLKPGTFRVRGDVIDIVPPTHDYYIRIDCFGDEVESISKVDTITGDVKKNYLTYAFYPAYDHASGRNRIQRACEGIEIELEERLNEFRNQGKLLEAERLENRTRKDMDFMKEFGRCPGIENYSRHIDGRKPGQRPWTLIDYLRGKWKDFLLLVDESHVTFPQIRGMYNGDHSRKQTLVEYGFRLPSALDNRPLNFEEFEQLMPSTVICTSATPGEYELERANNEVVEQIIRPTGLLDPLVEVRPTLGQIEDIMYEIRERVKKNERVMIVTLTIKMAEELSEYLKLRGIKVAYLHNETKTIERSVIITNLRKGKYDVLVGINLLREGLDIPEVSLICILDADKEGFLRSKTSLIQVIGRAARNASGKVIMYADSLSEGMKEAIDETNRRRKIQDEYNQENGIVPTTIVKEAKPVLYVGEDEVKKVLDKNSKYSRKEIETILAEWKKKMLAAAKQYDFEQAAKIRDMILEARAELEI